MSKNKAGLDIRLQPILKFAKNLYQKQSLLLTSLLFVLSILISPVIAQVPQITNIAQSQLDAFELIKQGRSFYESGEYQKAVGILQQAYDTFKQQGNKVNQAMVLSNLSLVYQHLGKWRDAQAAIETSLNLLKYHSPTQEALRIHAQTLDVQGKLQRDIGQSAKALETWQQATEIYAQIPEKNSVIQIQINQATAMQDLGLYPYACNTLINALDINFEKIGKTLKLNVQDCRSLTQLTTKDLDTFTDYILSTLDKEPTSQLKFDALRNLGDIFKVVVGNLKQSEKILLASEKIAKKLNDNQKLTDVYLSLGNVAIAIVESQPDNKRNFDSYIDKALLYYSDSVKYATSQPSKIWAKLNQLITLLKMGEWSKAEELWSLLKSELYSLPLSRTAIYAQINFANSFITLSQNKDLKPPVNIQLPTFTEIEQILINATKQARSLEDKRVEAYALGKQGFFYEFLHEQTQDSTNLLKAVKYTNEALKITSLEALDITYQLFWQLGRIYKYQKNIKDAILAYTKAFNILQSLRNDLVSINPEIQFYFREQVEPIYRELVDLDLQLALKKTNKSEDKQKLLEQARNVIESLQVAELNNFFRSVCLEANPKMIDTIDKNAAVIYPIILSNRLEIVLSLPEQPLRFYTPKDEKQNPITRSQLENAITELRKLREGKIYQDFQLPSQQLYKWIIQPFETELTNSTVKIKTLAFVLDGELRDIPIAALIDKDNHYLIEKYAIAITPGLQLLSPKPIVKVQLKVLAAGLSEIQEKLPAHDGFSKLPKVKDELDNIQQILSSKEQLQNNTFTKEALKNKIIGSSFSVVHLATHGKFSSNFEDTFILTWDERLNINQLNELLKNNALNNQRQPIELLVLSACQTLKGDKRAALGLAGVAVRAGARSTIATLWEVADESTSHFMQQLYLELKKAQDMNVNKAEVLRQAQLSFLSKDNQYSHPFFWAPFVLLGNWL